MLKLIIEDDEGRKTVVPFTRDEITIGRQEGNTIRLTERNVSRHHARLRRQNGHVLVEDLGSYNGVRINGERIQEPAQVKDGDLIQIGDYDLALQQEAAAQPIAPTIRVPAASLQEAMDAARAQTLELPTGAEDELDEPPAEEEQEGAEASSGDQRRHSTAVIRVDQVEMNRPRRVVDVDAEEAPRLVVVSPEFKGQEFACIRTEMRVGRTDDNDIALDHRSLSRTHAKIVREETGEWRVIDMQSANGLSVNGESYAQAPLNHGDLLELGHVKLRFVGAGQSANGLLHDGAARGSKKGLVFALLGVVLLGGAGGAAWFVFGHPQQPSGPPPAIVESPPSETPPPPRQAQTPPPETTPTPAVDPTPVPPAADPTAEALKRARASIDAREFDAAVTTLEAVKDGKGQRPAAAEELLREATTERDAGRALKRAREELDANKLPEAQKSLASAEGTLAFAPEYTALKERLDKALPKPTGTTKPTSATAPRTEQAQKLFAEGKLVLNQKDYKQAENIFRQCLEADPTFANCHLMKGAAVARQGRIDEAANYYREFLRLAPANDPMVPSVKAQIENYEKSKK